MAERTRRPRVGLAHSSPGASGVIARPNYVGPSGNGLVERMNAGRKPLRDQGDLENGSFRLQKAVPGTKEKRRGEAPIGAPVRVMGRLFPSAEGTGPTARRPRCGVPHSACRRFAPSMGHLPQRRPGAASPGAAELCPLFYKMRNYPFHVGNGRLRI